MKVSVVVAVDELSASHRARIGNVLGPNSRLTRIDRFAPEETYVAAMRDAVFMIGWPEPHLIASSPIEVLQLPSAGFDAYQRPDLRGKQSFMLCNARGVMSIAVAEHCLSLMFALVRRLPEHVRDSTLHMWQRRDRYDELLGSTVCIVGLGDIGTEVARRCSALRMRVVGVRRDTSTSHPFAERIVSLERLPDVLAEMDHVVLTVPANAETIGLFDARLLDAMKPGSRLYNLSRGTIVNEHALVQRLADGHLAGAALDVFQEEPLPPASPLWNLDNVIATPHVAGRSVREFDRFCDLCVENLGRFMRGEPLKNAVVL